MLDILELCNLNRLDNIFRVVKLRDYNGKNRIKNFYGEASQMELCEGGGF
jgi:hypothetical protein